ncbi:MAG: aromatic ring-hydroxylating dioxygenase subunit alpha, partial [Cyanobacteria bacterium J06628_4]
IAYLLLWLTRLSYYALRGEDGKIYDNIRFSTERLLPVDQPIARYVRYVNGLVPSRWSKSFPAAPLSSEALSLEKEALNAEHKHVGTTDVDLCVSSAQKEESEQSSKTSQRR